MQIIKLTGHHWYTYPLMDRQPPNEYGDFSIFNPIIGIEDDGTFTLSADFEDVEPSEPIGHIDAICKKKDGYLFEGKWRRDLDGEGAVKLFHTLNDKNHAFIGEYTYSENSEPSNRRGKRGRWCIILDEKEIVNQ
jgi:hypothetical protein